MGNNETPQQKEKRAARDKLRHARNKKLRMENPDLDKKVGARLNANNRNSYWRKKEAAATANKPTTPARLTIAATVEPKLTPSNRPANLYLEYSSPALLDKKFQDDKASAQKTFSEYLTGRQRERELELENRKLELQHQENQRERDHEREVAEIQERQEICKTFGTMSQTSGSYYAASLKESHAVYGLPQPNIGTVSTEIVCSVPASSKKEDKEDNEDWMAREDLEGGWIDGDDEELEYDDDDDKENVGVSVNNHSFGCGGDDVKENAGASLNIHAFGSGGDDDKENAGVALNNTAFGGGGEDDKENAGVAFNNRTFSRGGSETFDAFDPYAEDSGDHPLADAASDAIALQILSTRRNPNPKLVRPTKDSRPLAVRLAEADELNKKRAQSSGKRGFKRSRMDDEETALNDADCDTTVVGHQKAKRVRTNEYTPSTSTDDTLNKNPFWSNN